MYNIDRMEQDRAINMTAHKYRGLKSRLMERDFFEQNTRNTNYKNDENNNSNNDNKDDDNKDDDNNSNFRRTNKVGEITGQTFSVSDLEFGMPIRSTYMGERTQRNSVMPSRCDFNLFDDNDNDNGRNYNIAYNDPINPIAATYSSLTSVSTSKVIPELYGTDPGSFITVNINRFTVNLFSLLKNNLEDKFCISPYGLFNIFGALYFASNLISESDICDYYSMMASKDNVFEGLSYIMKLYNKSSLYKQLVLKHIIFVNNELPTSKDFIKYINSIVDIYPLAKNNIEKESKNINDYIEKLSDGIIYPISPAIISKAEILVANIGFIKPIWKYPFEKTFDSKFNGIKVRIIRMLGQVDNQYEYFEDNLNQIIEFRCNGDIMSMGLILPKELVIPDIHFEELNVLIKNLKTTYLGEVRIPVFTQQIKIKLTNLLYQNGLRSVFHKLYIPDLIKTETNISDIVQNLTVIVANNPGVEQIKNKRNNNMAISNVRFIADHPFIYYFKLIPTNTIILMGYYS